MYTLIWPPFALDFSRMTEEQVGHYAEWFHTVLPERAAILAQAVRDTADFEDWRPDRTPESLGPLGRWFAQQAELVARTDDEIRQERERLSLPIAVKPQRLSDRTISIAMDVAIYFAQVVLRNVKGAHWTQELNKDSIDYGQPVLAGFGKVKANPVGLMLNKAYKAARDDEQGSQLRELYDFWAAMA